MRVHVEKLLFQGISKAIFIRSFRALHKMTETLSTFEHQLWTHSRLTRYHSSLLLQVSKLRNSFSKVLLGVTAIHAVGTTISSMFVYLYTSIVYSFDACFDDSSMFECHFDDSPSSKIVFSEPYKVAFLELSTLRVGGETPLSHFSHYAILLIV